jgi:hypothetical protein
MNKIVKIIVGLVVILGIIGAVYFVFQKREEAKMGYVQFDDFVKQESNGEVYFENKESGLRFKVPQGWNYGPSQLVSVSLTTQDFKDFKETDTSRAFIPQTGCWIGASVVYEGDDSINYNRIKNDIERQNFVNTEKNNYAIVDINGTKFLKTDHLANDNKDNIGNRVSIELAQKNRVYSFESYLFGRDKEKCLQSFNDFLTTVSIEK